jgi:hypothetical protein
MTKALEIPMTCYDSRPASVARSPLILSTHTQVWSSSVDRSRLLGGCKPRSWSSASIASLTSMSLSYMQRRIWHSSNVRLRLVSCLDLELETRAWVKKSCWTTSAQTCLVSHFMCTFPRARSKTANPSSHTTMTPSLLSSSLSRARSCPCSSTATAFEGDGALQ